MDWTTTAELRRRIRMEYTVELPLLKERWKTILFGAAFQYVHGLFSQLAHRTHHPLPLPLHDVGFAILPELGKANEWVSETIFTTLFVSFLLWSFSPFVMARKRFYTVVLYARLLMVLVCCQTLRILSFSVTQLPAPNYHCRSPAATAVRPWPEKWWGHLTIDLQQQTTHGCGDLIFSSHTTFALVGMLTYTEYGTILLVKVVCWMAVALLSIMIVASRKHYTVDVVVAWYTVPLVFYALHRRWTTKRIPTDWPHRAAEPSPDLLEVVSHGGGPGGGPEGTGLPTNNLAKKGWKAQPVDWRPPSKLPQANGYMNGYSHVSPAGEGLGGPSYESSFSSSGSGSEGGASASNRQNTVSVARARSTQLAGISENEKLDEDHSKVGGHRRALHGRPVPGDQGTAGDQGRDPLNGEAARLPTSACPPQTQGAAL